MQTYGNLPPKSESDMGRWEPKGEGFNVEKYVITGDMIKFESYVMYAQLLSLLYLDKSELISIRIEAMNNPFGSYDFLMLVPYKYREEITKVLENSDMEKAPEIRMFRYEYELWIR